MKVTVQSVLPAAIDVVWKRLKQVETLRYVADGVMSYNITDAPTEWTTGTTINLEPVLWGKPQGDHYVTVMSVDEKKLHIVTHEKGGPVTRWDHTMQLVDIHPLQCRLIDTIEIEAGLRTPAIWLFAQYFYHHRHRRWKKLLSET